MNPAGPTLTPTPEERLLRLIRPKPKAPRAEPPAMGGMSAVLAGGGAARPSWPWGRVLLGALAAAVAAEVVVLGVELARDPLDGAAVLPALQPARDSGAALPDLDALPLLEAEAPRAVFAAPARETAQGSGAAPGASQALASRLTLMGIVSGDPPQAIIGDSQTQKTYFVTVGQTVAGEAVLRDILENRAVLDLHGQTLELVL
ncbi:MAG TPA: type II secretion system protein N [bacterium]